LAKKVTISQAVGIRKGVRPCPNVQADLIKIRGLFDTHTHRLRRHAGQHRHMVHSKGGPDHGDRRSDRDIPGSAAGAASTSTALSTRWATRSGG
jgi:hypothetical protein